MSSLFCAIDNSLNSFFEHLTQALGYGGLLALALAVEVLFIVVFLIKTFYSYEARLKRGLDRANKWLFKNKKIDSNNIRAFNAVIKKGPKRLVYFWQQYILYRDGDPSKYLTEENLVNNPLKTSSWQNNIRNLGLLTAVWSFVSFIFGLATQYESELGPQPIAVALVLPSFVAILGTIAIIGLKSNRVANLDDTYHMYHLFARFIDNACADLTPFIDFNLLFTPKEIENGNPQLREYYEARARKAKEEFENAKANDIQVVDYNFENVGVDGALLLKRAMKESEIYINKKTAALSQIAQIEAQKDALRRNYENVQMDLQRKIQATKENIQKLIEQQAATTSRIEVGLLRQQQEKESNKKAQLQKDYDNEEKRYLAAKEELEGDIRELNTVLDQSLDEVQKGMAAEYQTFFEKVMKTAYQVAESRVQDEKQEIADERDKNEQELISVQTQIKRLMDENETLRERLAQETGDLSLTNTEENAEQGYYDEYGNYIYSDGSYHDTQGLFHDVDGKVYNMQGELVSYDLTPEEEAARKEQELQDMQTDQYGAYIDNDNNVVPVEGQTTEEGQDETATDENVEADESDTTETPTDDEIPADGEAPTDDEVPADTDEAPTEQPFEEGEAQPEPEQSETDEGGTQEGVTEDAQTEQPPTTDEQQSVLTDEDIANMFADEQATEESAQQEESESNAAQPEESKQPQEETQAQSPSNTTEDKPANEDKPAKKRGRPRKVAEETQEATTQPKKRGRPRKTATEEQPVQAETPKKRGRPKKTEQTAKESAAKKPATPRKRTTTKKAESTPAETAQKKRGRPRKTQAQPDRAVTATAKPRKSTTKKSSTTNASKAPRKKTAAPKETAAATDTAPKKRGRPRKATNEMPQIADSSFLSKINELISAEENKLKNMKAYFNSEINDALVSDNNEEEPHDRDDIVRAVETLKAQADEARNNGQSNELAKINKQIEDLIKELSTINSDDEGGSQAN